MNQEKQLTIAFVTPYPPSKTTLNEYGFHLISHFQKKEEISEIQIYAEKLDSDQYYEHGDKLSFIPCWEFNSYRSSFHILKEIRKNQPDVVVINLQFLLFGDKKIPAALGLLLPTMLRMYGFKNIVLLHNILEEVDLKKAGITQNPILKVAYNFIGNILTRMILRADLVGVTIEKYVDTLRNKYKRKNIVLLPHGSFETPPTPDYKLPDGPYQVMTFGKFGTYKKVEVMIEAVELIRKRSDIDIEIVIAGTDNPNVKGYLKQVELDYGYVPQIRFTGYVAEEDVPKIFKESAVSVFPYTSTTGSSGVLHQAGSYGKAAVLPNIGDLARLVEEEGYQGVFFEPEDVEGLADAIELLLTNHVYRNKIEQANFRAASSLSMSDIADWYLIHMEKLGIGK